MGWNLTRRAPVPAPEREQLDLLATVPAFAGCSPDELEQIAHLGTELRRAAGTVLVRAGATLRQALVVLDGVVSEQPALGREQAVSSGHLLGAEGLARPHSTASASAVALTDVRVLVFGPLELADVSALVESGVRRRAERARRPERRTVLEPAWGSAAPALA